MSNEKIQQPEISVGVSDTILLTISGIGFMCLAYTIYSIIITKVKSRQELDDDDDENNISFGEKLAKADISTLSRAQRRARARHIMKQQRRVIEPSHTNWIDENQQEGRNEQAVVAQQPQPHEEDIPPFQDDFHHITSRHLSRKERQKVAKQVEIQERKLLEEQRRKEQKQAQEDARNKKIQKERQLAIQLEKERKKRQERQKNTELKAYKAWQTFLPPLNTSNNNALNNQSITVKEWIKELQKDRMVSLESLSKRFHVSEDEVKQRIEDLIASSQVSGILEANTGRFIYLSPNDMASLASFANAQEKMTIEVFQRQIQELCST